MAVQRPPQAARVGLRRFSPSSAPAPPPACRPATLYSTQEDPIGLAGGLNLYGYAAGDPINNHDPFGLDVVFKNDENGVMANSWAHAKRTLRSSASAGDADAQTALMAMRRMENDRERTYTFENVDRARGLGNAEGTTATIAVGAIGVAREYDRKVVNVASTLVHEAGHLYYENGPGAINPTSYWSQAWAMSFDNAYRRSVNMAERQDHNSYPRRP